MRLSRYGLSYICVGYIGSLKNSCTCERFWILRRGSDIFRAPPLASRARKERESIICACKVYRRGRESNGLETASLYVNAVPALFSFFFSFSDDDKNVQSATGITQRVLNCCCFFATLACIWILRYTYIIPGVFCPGVIIILKIIFFLSYCGCRAVFANSRAYRFITI